MFRQIFNVTASTLLSIPSRKGSSFVVVIGIAGVVCVIVGLLSMSDGIKSALEATSHPDRVVVMRSGTKDEITGWLSSSEVNVLKGVDGIGKVSGELVVVLDLILEETTKPGVAIVRGVETSALDVRPELEVVAGRVFQPGKNELIVGIHAKNIYRGLTLGNTIEIRKKKWQIVGYFDAQGRAHDSEIWMDLPIAQTTFRRDGVVSTVRALLDESSSVSDLRDHMRRDPRIRADLISERDFYSRQSQARTAVVDSFTLIIGVIMGLGAVIAAINTMYTSVSARSIEIGTLRSLGFSNVPVVTSVITEALILALIGGLLGGVIVYLSYDGLSSSTLGLGSMSHVGFEFSVTPRLLFIGIGNALLLGLIGGLTAALHAARLPIIEALESH